MINTTRAEGWLSRLASDQTIVADANRGAADAFGSLVSRGNPPLHVVLDGLSQGYRENGETASEYFCTVTSTLVKYLGAAGALILIVMGVYQAIQFLKSAGSAVLAGLKMVYDLFGGGWSGVGSIADAVFGKARADAASTASLNMLELAFTAALPGPLALVRASFATPGSSTPGVTTTTGPGTAVPPPASTIVPPPTTTTTNNTTLVAAIVDAVAGLLGGMSDNQRRTAYDSAMKGVKRGIPPQQIITRLRDSLKQSR